MISVFQIFRIIMGLIIAGFLFYVIMQFSGIYAWYQEGQQEKLIMQSFLETAGSVYVHNVPTSFIGFEKFSDLRYDSPPAISSSAGDAEADVPLFLRPGKSLYVYRQTLELGWWRFNWVGALPEMKIVFNPLNCSPECWKVMQDLAEILPQSRDPEITMGFCTGERELEGVERDYFISAIKSPRDLNLAPCTRSFPPGYFLIAISDEGAVPAGGVLVEPLGNGTGYIRYKNSTFIYSDPLDILAVLMSLDNIWGSDTLYKYKNSLLLSELALAARKEAERCELMRLNRRCTETYGELGQILCSDENSICRLAEAVRDSGYTSLRDFIMLKDLNAQAGEKYGELEAEGCE